MPGSTRDDVARLEDVARLGPQTRRLVDLEPDAVAEAVAVVLARPAASIATARAASASRPVHARRDGREPSSCASRQSA